MLVIGGELLYLRVCLQVSLHSILCCHVIITPHHIISYNVMVPYDISHHYNMRVGQDPLSQLFREPFKAQFAVP